MFSVSSISFNLRGFSDGRDLSVIKFTGKGRIFSIITPILGDTGLLVYPPVCPLMLGPAVSYSLHRVHLFVPIVLLQTLQALTSTPVFGVDLAL